MMTDELPAPAPIRSHAGPEHGRGRPQNSLSRFRRILHLKSQPQNQGLPDELIAMLGDLAEEWVYEHDDALYREGVPATRLNMIVSGAVDLYRGGRFVRRLGAGSAVGGPATLAEERGYDAFAVGRTLTLRLTRDDMTEVFEEYFVLLARVLRGVTNELLAARRKLPGAGFSGEIADDYPVGDDELGLVERMRVLMNVMGFAVGFVDAVAELATDVDEVTYDEGEVIFEEGDPSDWFVFPFVGHARGYSAEEDVSFVLGPGDVLGSLESFAQQPRWYTATVVKPMRALRLKRDTMMEVMEDDSSLGLAFMQTLSRGMLETYDLVAQHNSELPPRQAPAAE